MRQKGLSRILLLALLAVTAMLVVKIFHQGWEPGVVVSLSDLEADDLEVTSFLVEQEPAPIEISATGSRQIDTLLAAYPWILRRSDRSLVWKMDPDPEHRESGMLVSVEERVTLDPGEYDVYFASYGHPGQPTAEPEGFIDRLIARFNDEFAKWRTEANKWQIVIKAGSEEGQQRLRPIKTTKSRPSYPLTIWDSGPVHGQSVSEFLFEATRPVDIVVRCTGSNRDGARSGGWIENVETGERVWDMETAETRHAGGALANRVDRKALRLNGGLYRAAYESSNRHTYKDWYGNPPYDPLSWGMVLTAESERDLAAISSIDAFETFPKIVALTGIGNDELVSYTFRIEEPLRVLVYAVGEGYTRSGDIFDYAWLVDDKRRREIWKMSIEKTDHAGGASKNRRAEVVLSLDPGRYTVHYKTDGSHSFEGWNDDPPRDPHHWGVTVFALNPDFVPNVDAGPSSLPAPPSDLENGRKPVVAMTSLGDYASVSERFVLEEKSKLHIFALGEMTLDGRYDYGWITDHRTGRMVWEMTRENSVKAGGTSKNRKVDTFITLPAGEYEAHFRTDDSHSYPGFKYGGAPDHPEAWGMTIWVVPAQTPTPPSPPDRPGN